MDEKTWNFLIKSIISKIYIYRQTETILSNQVTKFSMNLTVAGQRTKSRDDRPKSIKEPGKWKEKLTFHVDLLSFCFLFPILFSYSLVCSGNRNNFFQVISSFSFFFFSSSSVLFPCFCFLLSPSPFPFPDYDQPVGVSRRKGRGMFSSFF